MPTACARRPPATPPHRPSAAFMGRSAAMSIIRGAPAKYRKLDRRPRPSRPDWPCRDPAHHEIDAGSRQESMRRDDGRSSASSVQGRRRAGRSLSSTVWEYLSGGRSLRGFSFNVGGSSRRRASHRTVGRGPSATQRGGPWPPCDGRKEERRGFKIEALAVGGRATPGSAWRAARAVPDTRGRHCRTSRGGSEPPGSRP